MPYFKFTDQICFEKEIEDLSILNTCELSNLQNDQISLCILFYKLQIKLTNNQFRMTSAVKRKQLVNELRKAHFPFGFEGGDDVMSEYKKKYIEYELKHGKNAHGPQPNNFSIGSEDLPNDKQYLSEFKERYPGYDASNQPRRPAKHEGQNNNIVFGYDDQPNQTNYKDDYTKKGNYGGRQKPVDQRKTNIDLGDSLSNFTTTYNQVYDKKEIAKPEKHAPQFRKSNLMLGNDNPAFLTSHAASYVPMPTVAHGNVKRNYGTNIELGTGANNYASQHKQNFAHKAADRQVVDKDKVRDFRSAHFHFGFPQGNQQPQSQHQANFDEKPIQHYKAQGKKPSNIDLNVDGNTYFNSTYNNQFQNRPADRAPIAKGTRASNVLIGTDPSDPSTYLTEHKAQFIGKDGNNPRVEMVKPQGKFVIGEHPADYITHNQVVYTDKFNDRDPNRVTQEDILRMKQVNFVGGFQGNDYGLHSQQYGSKTGLPNKLSKQQIAGMRNTNVVSGDHDPFKGGTTYRAEFLFKQGKE